VQRFIRLVTNSFKGKSALKQLNEWQIRAINDKSYFSENQILKMDKKKGGAAINFQNN
jgi:hypothetical protein